MTSKAIAFVISFGHSNTRIVKLLSGEMIIVGHRQWLEYYVTAAELEHNRSLKRRKRNANLWIGCIQVCSWRGSAAGCWLGYQARLRTH
jgi:hypothetical protein